VAQRELRPKSQGKLGEENGPTDGLIDVEERKGKNTGTEGKSDICVSMRYESLRQRGQKIVNTSKKEKNGI